MESRWKLFRKEPSSTTGETYSAFISTRYRSPSVDRVLHSHTTSKDTDGDSIYGFTRDWLDMPPSTRSRATGSPYIKRTKSQSSVCYLQQRENDTALLSRSREKLPDRSDHSGGSGVIKWLRNSFRRSRSRSNSRKDKHGKESDLGGPNPTVSHAKNKSSNVMPKSKTKDPSTDVYNSNVKNKVKIFEQKSTKCLESSQVTENLNRYALIKAQQHDRNRQLLSAHQAALSCPGVIPGVRHSTDLDTAGQNVGAVIEENVHRVAEMSSGVSDGSTRDKHTTIIGINSTRGGHVGKSEAQLGGDGSSGLIGKEDVHRLSSRLRLDPSNLTASDDRHVDHEKNENTCKNSVANLSVLTTQTGQQKHKSQINDKRISQSMDGTSIPNNLSNYSRKKPALTGGPGRRFDCEHTHERVIQEEGPRPHTSQRSVDHRSDQPQYLTHAQTHHNSSGSQVNNTDSTSKLTVDHLVITSRHHSANIETVDIGNDVDHGQSHISAPDKTAQVLDKFQQIDSDYKNQLKSFGQKYFSSASGSLQKLPASSLSCLSGVIITDNSPHLRQSLPLETHFDHDSERRESVCSFLTYSESMVNCKEAIQKATTVISRSNSSSRPHTPDEIASKVKAYEELSRDLYPAISEHSKEGSASGSDISARHGNKSIISKIENVGTHSSYFHASDIAGNVETDSCTEVAADQSDLFASGNTEKMDKEGTESSVWNESGSEDMPAAAPPQPLNFSTPCQSRVYEKQNRKELYEGNWNHLKNGNPSLQASQIVRAGKRPDL